MNLVVSTSNTALFGLFQWLYLNEVQIYKQLFYGVTEETESVVIECGLSMELWCSNCVCVCV